LVKPILSDQSRILVGETKMKAKPSGRQKREDYVWCTTPKWSGDLW